MIRVRDRLVEIQAEYSSLSDAACRQRLHEVLLIADKLWHQAVNTQRCVSDLSDRVRAKDVLFKQEHAHRKAERARYRREKEKA